MRPGVSEPKRAETCQDSAPQHRKHPPAPAGTLRGAGPLVRPSAPPRPHVRTAGSTSSSHPEPRVSPEPSAPLPARSGQGSTLATVAHLGGVLTYLFAGWVVSLVVWLVQREQDRATAEEARVALNFQLTALIAMVVMHVVEQFPVIGVIGYVGKLAVGVVALVLSLLAAAATYRGGSYRYPVSLELVR